ncbi:MAG: malonyl-ACP O-methyltransferase BioC [Marinifilaceae bacterium]
MNKANIERAFSRNYNNYDEHARVQRMVAERTAYLFKKYRTENTKHILEIGCGTGLLTAEMQEMTDNGSLYINDLSVDVCNNTANKFHIAPSNCLPGDMETLSLPCTFDAVVSSSVFQWFTHPQEVIDKLADSLNEEGIMVIATFGENNMTELYDVLDKVMLQQRTQQEWTELFDTRFELLHTEQTEHILYFDTIIELLKHIKYTGVNGCNGDKEIWTRGRIELLEERYRDKHLFCGKLPVTYQPVYFVVRKR